MYCGVEFVDLIRCGVCGVYKIGLIWYWIMMLMVGVVMMVMGW